MFELFTDRAQRVVTRTEEESRALGHPYLGTEHLLLSLLREDESVAAATLNSLDISLAEIRTQLLQNITAGIPRQAPSGHVPFTPRAKKVLHLAQREAEQFDHHYIGTEHLLLGVIREGGDVAARVLLAAGADLNRVRQQVLQVLVARHPDGAAAAPAADSAGAGSSGEANSGAPAPVSRELTCSFCQRSSDRGVAGPDLSVFACDECIADMVRTRRPELGDNWPASD